MSFARRRVASNDGRTRRHIVHQNSKIKPQITLCPIQSNLDPLPLPTSVSPTLPIAPHAGRKFIFGAIAILLTVVFTLLRVTGRLTVTPNTPPGYSTPPIPNTASLPSQGRVALQELSLESIQALPSQVTFIFSVPQHTARDALPLISRLQLLDTQIHLLVPLKQAKELEYLLDTLLPTRSNIHVYSTVSDGAETALDILHHVKHVRTPWVWIMSDDHMGDSQSVETWVANAALKVPRVQVLTGIYGARLTEFGVACVSSTNQPEPVAFLVPPFLAPTSLLVESEPGIIPETQANVWASLGERVGRITGLGMGGAVISAVARSPGQCTTSRMVGSQGVLKVSGSTIASLWDQFRSSTSGKLQFAFLLPDLASLKRIAPTVCRVLQNGHDLSITVRGLSSPGREASSRQQYLNYGCHLHYTASPATGHGHDEDLSALANSWCSPSSLKDKILIVSGDGEESRYSPIQKSRVCATAAIYLHDGDLENSEWLSMLTPEEWRGKFDSFFASWAILIGKAIAWDKPAIELAVITHDRPWSLRRLLDSVKRAHYFGDTVDVVINLEQTSDQETRQIAEEFTMGPTGHVSVRHRIVYAGLMTAVVESWYPHGNHSYGVMLEDDVELSPLFYAWIKFCVLRYRYGTPLKDAAQLYGISLYQPKVTELHMQGRRPFNARDIFASANIEHPHTPYLSQVPCSWGAVYFPEHWREFRQYLSLLYLQGYASLYPNYDHFVSLSTNHLEVGEHVPANIDQEKQRQYFLPLMQESEVANRHPGTELGVKLLDLPLSNLPEWADLPVLDLWGGISSLKKLRSVGLERRVNMSVCQPDEMEPSALEYLCPPKETGHLEAPRKSLYTPSTGDDDLDLMQG